MMWVENQTFTDQSVKLDFNRWRGCTFEHCEIVVEYGVYDLEFCNFQNCKFTAAGRAEAIMKLFKMAFPIIPFKEDTKNPFWVVMALNWINKANPDVVKGWVYEVLLKKDEESGDKTQ